MFLNCGVGSLRSPAEGEGHEGFPPPPNKDLLELFFSLYTEFFAEEETKLDVEKVL